MEAKKSNQEIDLLEVLVKFVDYLKANVFLAIFLPVAGALIGVGASHITDGETESNMMIETSLLSDTECDFFMNELENADTFPNLSTEAQQKFLGLSHQLFKAPPTGTKPEKTTVHLQITLGISDARYLKEYQESILYYLEHTIAAVRKKKELSEFYSNMIREIDQELAALATVKSNVGEKTNVVSLSTSSIYTESVDLMEKKLTYQQLAQTDHIFQIVKGFDTLTTNRKISTAKYVALGACTGFAVLIFFLFIRYFSSYYRRYHQQHPN